MLRTWFKPSPTAKSESSAEPNAEEKRRTETICLTLATIPTGTAQDVEGLVSPDPAQAKHIALLGGGSFSKVELVSIDCEHGPRLFARRSMKITADYDVREYIAERKALQVARGSPFLMQEFMAYEDHKSRRPLRMITELLPNGDLRNLLKGYQRTHKRTRGFLELDARFFFGCLVLGLEHLHKRNFAHRDIKPDNVLLTADNYAVLGDFGAASEAWQCSFSGTPAYMAPEYYKFDTKALSLKTDIWSLGVMLIQLVDGSLPEWAQPAADHMQCPRPLCWQGRLRLPSYFSTELKDLIRKMLMMEPVSRPSISEVRQHRWFRGLDWAALAAGALPGPLPELQAKVAQGTTDSRLWRFKQSPLCISPTMHRCISECTLTQSASWGDLSCSKDNASDCSVQSKTPWGVGNLQGDAADGSGDWLLPAYSPGRPAQYGAVLSCWSHCLAPIADSVPSLVLPIRGPPPTIALAESPRPGDQKWTDVGVDRRLRPSQPAKTGEDYVLLCPRKGAAPTTPKLTPTAEQLEAPEDTPPTTTTTDPNIDTDTVAVALRDKPRPDRNSRTACKGLEVAAERLWLSVNAGAEAPATPRLPQVSSMGDLAGCYSDAGAHTTATCSTCTSGANHLQGTQRHTSDCSFPEWGAAQRETLPPILDPFGTTSYSSLSSPGHSLLTYQAPSKGKCKGGDAWLVPPSPAPTPISSSLAI